MLMVLVLGLSVLALAVAWGLRGYVLRQDNGTPDMRKISDAIQEGAEAFLRRQYRTIGTLSIALGVRACLAGQRVLFRTATEWVARLADAKHDGRLEDELVALRRIPLLIVDEVGYIPFDPQAANLMFALVSSRYERASMIVTSNKPFSAWGEIFGDDMAATAMIDRLIHHSEILSLKGDSYRLRDKDLGGPPPAERA